MDKMNIVILGLSITSSWGNGHATTFRSLVSALAKRGHDTLFIERDVPWYADHRDLPEPQFCKAVLYKDIQDLKTRFAKDIRDAHLVMVGSYVPEGVQVGKWITETAGGVTAFYDIDTPITFTKLYKKDYEYLAPDLIPKYDMYLSFSGGPVLSKLEEEFGARTAKPFYCCVDTALYYSENCETKWDLGYLGTYSSDRQPSLELFLNKPAGNFAKGRFIVAGPMYPENITWATNVERISHIPPHEHRSFYNSQRLTLNLTREDMRNIGWSPSVRLFEAAACATPVISDWWEGLDDFFTPGKEILIAHSTEDVLKILTDLPFSEIEQIGRAAQERCLAEYSAELRALELEQYVDEAVKLKIRGSRKV